MSLKDELAGIHQNALDGFCEPPPVPIKTEDVASMQEAKKMIEEFIIPTLKEIASTKPKLTRYSVRFNFYHYRHTGEGFVQSDLDAEALPCSWHYESVCFAYNVLAEQYGLQVEEWDDLFSFYIDLEEKPKPTVPKLTLEKATVAELFAELAKRFQNANFDIHAVKY